MSNWKLDHKGLDYEIYVRETELAIMTFIEFNYGLGIVDIYSKVEGKDGYLYDAPITKLTPEDIEFIAQKTKELLNVKELLNG